MKKNGFTLMELLAVIVILGVILALVIGSVQSTMDKSVNSSIKFLKKEISDATKRYINENYDPARYPENEGDTQNTIIYAKDLIDEGYLEDLKNPDDQSSCYNSDTAKDTIITVSITKTAAGNYKSTYTVTLKCGDTGEEVIEEP